MVSLILHIERLHLSIVVAADKIASRNPDHHVRSSSASASAHYLLVLSVPTQAAVSHAKYLVECKMIFGHKKMEIFPN